LGRSNLAPPEGDSTVNPGNTLFWVNPPIKDGPVGMLIGAIWPAKGELPPGLGDPTASLFRVGGGRAVTMEADGWLFLGVNDGAFFNNTGCFQAKVTKAR
jgi:hypothetical protein